MATAKGKAFLADAERDYHAKRGQIEHIELSLADSQGERWRVHFRACAPMRDLKKIEAARDRGGLIDMAVETLILRACDEEGALMFEKGDRFALLNKIDAEIALEIGVGIGGHKREDLETAEKNSETPPN